MMTATLRRAGLTILTVTVGLLAAAFFAGQAAAAEVAVTHLSAAWNPLQGISPDFSLFGPTVGQTWRRFAAAIWALCLAACSMWMILAGVSWARANKRGMGMQQADAKAAFLDAATGFAVCAGSSIVIGGVIFALGL